MNCSPRKSNNPKPHWNTLKRFAWKVIFSIFNYQFKTRNRLNKTRNRLKCRMLFKRFVGLGSLTFSRAPRFGSALISWCHKVRLIRSKATAKTHRLPSSLRARVPCDCVHIVDCPSSRASESLVNKQNRIRPLNLHPANSQFESSLI